MIESCGSVHWTVVTFLLGVQGHRIGQGHTYFRYENGFKRDCL